MDDFEDEPIVMQASTHEGMTWRRAWQAMKGVSEVWHPQSGGVGARALNPTTAGPLPATLLGPFVSECVEDPQSSRPEGQNTVVKNHSTWEVNGCHRAACEHALLRS